MIAKAFTITQISGDRFDITDAEGELTDSLTLTAADEDADPREAALRDAGWMLMHWSEWTADDDGYLHATVRRINPDEARLGVETPVVLRTMLTQSETLEALNAYDGDNIYTDIVNQIYGYDENATNEVDPEYSLEAFVICGVTYRWLRDPSDHYESTAGSWVVES